MRNSVVFTVLFSLYINSLAEDTCYLTGRTPADNHVLALGFCRQAFRHDNCCLPGFDEEIKETYDELLGTSELCASSVTQSKLSLLYIFCFGCSSNQPKYLKEVGTFHDAELGSDYTLYNISICRSIAKDVYPEAFDDCGMIIPGERGNVCEGDDTVIPSEQWGTGEEGVLAFLNDDVGGKPPLFTNSDEERFQVVLSDVDCYTFESGANQLNFAWTTLLGSLVFCVLSILH